MPAYQAPSLLNKPFALKRTYRDVCWYSDHINVVQSRSTEQLSVCLVSFAPPSLGTRGRPSGQLQAEEPERKLDEQKESKASTSLWQPCWFRDGACTQRAHCERGSTPYSCGVLAPDTHIAFTQRLHTEKVEPRFVRMVATESFKADVETDLRKVGMFNSFSGVYLVIVLWLLHGVSSDRPRPPDPAEEKCSWVTDEWITIP